MAVLDFVASNLDPVRRLLILQPAIEGKDMWMICKVAWPKVSSILYLFYK